MSIAAATAMQHGLQSCEVCGLLSRPATGCEEGRCPRCDEELARIMVALEELEGRSVKPLEVLDDEDPRRPGRHLPHDVERELDGLLLQTLRRELRRRLHGQREEGGEDGQSLVAPHGEGGETGLQLL